MAKKLSQDFGIFGDMSEASPDAPASEKTETPTSDVPNDIFGIGSEELPMEEEGKEETPPESTEEDKGEDPSKEGTPEDKEALPGEPADTEAAEAEIMRLIEEASAGFDELAKSENLTPEDQKKIQDLSDSNDELTAKIESLSRQLDAARELTNKNLESGEELRIYKPLMDKLEKDPQLMLFAKYYGSKNDTMKGRLTDICKDMLHNLTGIDVYALMDENATNSATALGNEAEEAVPPAIDTPQQVTGQKYTRKKDPTFTL